MELFSRTLANGISSLLHYFLRLAILKQSQKDEEI